MYDFQFSNIELGPGFIKSMSNFEFYEELRTSSLSVQAKQLPLKDVHLLMAETCDCVTLHGKGAQEM